MAKLTSGALYSVFAVTVLSCATACSTMSRETSDQQQADKATAESVQNALNADSHIYARHISVQADNGVVHLGGYVWNDDDLYEAQRIAEAVPGVSKVVDDMELERGGIDNSATSR